MTDLARRCRVPVSTLSELERGKSKISDRTSSLLVRLADALGVHPDRLLEKANLTAYLTAAGQELPPEEELKEVRLFVTPEEYNLITEYLDFLRVKRRGPVLFKTDALDPATGA
jgi:transcriptional regulator with XRE-family HTH domain